MTTTERGLGWPEPGLVVVHRERAASVGWPVGLSAGRSADTHAAAVATPAMPTPGDIATSELSPARGAVSIVSLAAGGVRASLITRQLITRPLMARPMVVQPGDQESWDWIDEWERGHIRGGDTPDGSSAASAGGTEGT